MIHYAILLNLINLYIREPERLRAKHSLKVPNQGVFLLMKTSSKTPPVTYTA